MNTAAAVEAPRELIADEMDLLKRLLPLPAAEVADVGCGKAEMSRRLVEEGLALRVTALEVDPIQLTANRAAPHLPGLRFVLGGAEAIPAPEASFDVVLMFKSLHHVPLAAMDVTFAEIRRVLRPRGLLYVSEPMFAGPFNEIVRLFHDEQAVRAAALAAIGRAVDSGRWRQLEERHFDAPLAFTDFGDFVRRIVRTTHSSVSIEGDVGQEVRRRFDTHMTSAGARFVRPMRVNLLQPVG